MEKPKTLPMNWQEADVQGWRLALTPLDSLGFPMGKFGARVDAPEEGELEQFAERLSELVKETILQEMGKRFRSLKKEETLTLD